MSAVLSPAERDEITGTLRAAFERQEGDQVDDVLDSFGWPQLLAADPSAAVSIVFGLLGATARTASVLDDVILANLAASLAARPATVALGLSAAPDGTAGSRRDGRLDIDAVCVGSADSGPILAAVDSDEGVRFALVPAGSLKADRIAGMDPWMGLTRLRGSTAAAEPFAADALLDAWRAGIRAARIALGHQLVGGAQAALTLAAEHARERVQFGRPIGTFQAVQHRLAEAFVAAEAAGAALEAAAESHDPLAALVAKSMAGRAATVGGAASLQVLGGIGFTAEHRLHRYLKRGLVLDRLLGSSGRLPAVIGRALVSRRSVPRFVEL